MSTRASQINSYYRYKNLLVDDHTLYLHKSTFNVRLSISIFQWRKILLHKSPCHMKWFIWLASILFDNIASVEKDKVVNSLIILVIFACVNKSWHMTLIRLKRFCYLGQDNYLYHLNSVIPFSVCPFIARPPLMLYNDVRLHLWTNCLLLL